MDNATPIGGAGPVDVRRLALVGTSLVPRGLVVMSLQYENFRQYLAKDIKPVSPYQYLMLRALLEKNGCATTQKIADKIHSHYQYFPLEDYEKNRVDELPGQTLFGRGLVQPARKGYALVAEYDPNKMCVEEIETLLDICKRGSKRWSMNTNGRWTRGKLPRREPV